MIDEFVLEEHKILIVKFIEKVTGAISNKFRIQWGDDFYKMLLHLLRTGETETIYIDICQIVLNIEMNYEENLYFAECAFFDLIEIIKFHGASLEIYLETINKLLLCQNIPDLEFQFAVPYLCTALSKSSMVSKPSTLVGILTVIERLLASNKDIIP